MLIHFVRHGESQANAENILSYRVVDPALTAQGRMQALLLARWAKRRRVAALYSSPSRRAVETARAISVECRLGTFVTEMLREVNVGLLDGHSDDEALATYRLIVEAWQRGSVTARFPGGESLNEAQERIDAFIHAALERDEAKTIVAVGHGEILSVVLARMLGNTDLPVMRHASVTSIRCEADGTMRCESWAVQVPGANRR